MENRILGNLDMLSDYFIAWLAGFIDGDGSIYARIVRGSTYVLGFQIVVSVSFTQSIYVFHILEMIYDALGKKGSIRKRGSVGDVVISDSVFLVKLLTRLIPFLYLKKKQAKLLIEIVEEYSAHKSVPHNKKNPNDRFTERQAAFLKVCEKVEQVAELNSPGQPNPRRKITLAFVEQEFLNNNSC
jgi:hypothetical protein